MLPPILYCSILYCNAPITHDDATRILFIFVLSCSLFIVHSISLFHLFKFINIRTACLSMHLKRSSTHCERNWTLFFRKTKDGRFTGRAIDQEIAKTVRSKPFDCTS